MGVVQGLIATLKTSASSGYDADADAYFTAAGITNTGEKNAYNTFVLGCKTDSIYNKLKTFHPMLGSSLTTKSYNAINTSLSQINWTGSYNVSVGVDCDGGSGNFSVSGLSATNSGMGIFVHYYGDIPIDTYHLYMSSGPNIGLEMRNEGSGNIIYDASDWGANNFSSESAGYSNGLLAIQSVSQSGFTCRLYEGDDTAYWRSSTGTTISTISSVHIGDINGTYSTYNTICCCFTSEGLIESEMIALKSRIYTLMTTLSRV